MDKDIKSATHVDDIDARVVALDELYDAVHNLADEVNFHILLRRITSVKKNAYVVREALLETNKDEDENEPTSEEWANKQREETTCLYIAGYIALCYLSVIITAVFIR